MIKNQIITGTCVDYTYDGLGVVKYDTFCIFVKGMLKDEVGQIVITLVKKNFAYGRLLKLINASNERVDAICSNAKQCGGCQLQHFSYEHQKEFKRDIVENDMRKISKIDNEVLPVLAMDSPYGYRNKVMLPVGKDKNGKSIMGFYRYNSHDIIQIDECSLQSERSNKLIKKIHELLDKYHLADLVRHVMIRDMLKTDQMMLVLVCYKNEKDRLKDFCKEIVEYETSIKSIVLNINNEDTNVVLGKQDILLYGQDHIIDQLCGLNFKISSHSFYQVNTYQTERLYMQAIKSANLSKDDNILDLYCGVGTIGLIASQFVKKVTGVEIVEQAIENAKENAKINNIDNIEFICGDAQKLVKEFENKGIHFDCIFVDPPRKGCSTETIKTLIELNSEKIVYISCQPSTLARDLAILKEYYNIEMIQPVDMFPQTYHVETVCLLFKIHEKNVMNVELDLDGTSA